VSDKRVSTVDPAGPSVPMGKLSRRRRPDEDAVEPTNYLYPRIPSSRMGIPHSTTSIADSSHRITSCMAIKPLAVTTPLVLLGAEGH